MIGRRIPPSTDEADKPKGFDDYELRLGDIMRGERATLAKSLLDVQRELKIKASYIAAIENADVSAFETPGFVAGYVRSYARYLGLDPEWAFRRFCDEAKFTVVHGMSSAASGPRTSRPKIEYSEPLANPNAIFVPRGASFWSGIQPSAIGSVAVLLVLIGGIGYGGWTVLQEVQKVQLAPIDQAPVVTADLDPLQAGATGPGGGSGGDLAELAGLPGDDTLPQAPDTLDRLYRPEALDVPVLVARDGPIAAIDPRTVGALAGAEPIGLVPKRRTALIVRTPDGLDGDAWPLNVQLAGPLDGLRARLLLAGWEPQATGGWTGLLQTLDKDARPRSLPVLPATHLGRAEALVLVRRGEDPARKRVLRLWATPVRLQPGDRPLWIGTVQELRFARRLDFFSYWQAQPEDPALLEALQRDVTGLETRLEPRGDDDQPVLRMRAPGDD